MALTRDAMVASYGTSRLLYTLECHPCASLGPIQLSVQAYTVLHVGMRPKDLMKYHSGLGQNLEHSLSDSYIMDIPKAGHSAK